MNATTAYHEAGHAVAHVRLGILAGNVTIVATPSTLGSATAEGVDSVYSRDGAKDQILAFCSGYASLVAAGYSDEEARNGCGDDFEQADYLIGFWGLGSLEDWLSQAVAFMRREENIKAVGLVAEHLTRHGTLESEYIENLVMFADGECTAAEWDKYLSWRFSQLCN